MGQRSINPLREVSGTPDKGFLMEELRLLGQAVRTS